MKNLDNKYNAIWLSHSSISDFLKCPRLYYLKNVWKNKAGRKVNTVSPYMSLGSAVHQTIEPLANLKLEDRLKKFQKSEGDIFEETELLKFFYANWQKFSGLKGGFENQDQEADFKKRGEEMIKNVINNNGPLANKTVKFYTGDFIPNIYLSEKENVILCGLVDWVEYLEKEDALKVIDFKTGKNDEKEDSFQLPIYKILVENLQKRKVISGAYWYLDRDKFPTTKEFVDEDVEEVKEQILDIGLQIKKLKQTEDLDSSFKCKYQDKNDGSFKCFACNEMEYIKKYDSIKDKKTLTDEEKSIIEKVIYLGAGEYKQDLYFIKK